VTDEHDHWTIVEPSPEDFEAAEEEPRPVGARAVVVRSLRVLGTLIVIFALLFYLVVPFNNVVTRVLRRIHVPNIKLRPIPLAPDEQALPRRPV
jgi:hypothetical protein